MQAVVIGGTGRVAAASPSTGVNTLTGAGFDNALSGADVVVDVSNSPSFGDEARVPDALLQPIAAADLATEVAGMAEGKPLGGIANVGGPEKISFEQMARDVLARRGQAKTVVVDPDVGYFGTPLATNSLVTA
ncbi:hypothetical protein [Mycobacterium ostraviense]|uniref:Uncharacterized protein n=1 Tax=Mycobacterium ostraviense TaxID=2738409 RepID=A0A164ATQ7_9MYCO|nr:hypothetical protein [Mycobacterium ostraviense]KZS62800.1 hypothetical protein A4G28_11810 [Mycobacterium ostraviense]UGT91745.1 hypothetical protein LTS72_27165 [Mycobacterium ostraviense]